MGAAGLLDSERPITVPHHASLAGANRAGLTSQGIASEVREALRAGRYSVERPAWLQPGAPAEQGWYCWPPHEQHAYVVAERAGYWIVKTLITPRMVRRDFIRCQGKPALRQALERAGA
jgi:hypothetical protein